MEFTKCIYTLHEKMRECKQTDTMSIMQHGLDVSAKYNDILKILSNKMDNIYQLPEKLFEIFRNRHDELLDDYIMNHYHIYHDCGKSLCLEIDKKGRQHFPNHSMYSYTQFKMIFPDKETEALMILHDMYFHTMKTEDLKDLALSKYGFSLYLTSWAEIFSNAEMFGGTDSISFKIKKKKLIKALKLFN